MIDSMLSDPAFANIQPGQRKVIAIGKIINDTPNALIQISSLVRSL